MPTPPRRRPLRSRSPGRSRTAIPATQGTGGAAITTGTTTVTITAANDAPLLTGSQAILTGGTEDTAFTVRAVDLLQGFADPEDTTLVLSNLSVDHGTIVSDGAGGYTVTPAADYNGPLVDQLQRRRRRGFSIARHPEHGDRGR